ncbi:MAG: 3-methylornithyl-N6-L-lysine dehydrogenase PylD [Emergencia sp.]
MTRLKTEWITYMLDGMESYNRQLAAKTGFDLAGLMADTFQMSIAQVEEVRAAARIAVIPVTQGEGIIGCFSESVAAIVRSMGFRADVMKHTDVDGIYDAARRGYDILFMADDIRYMALNIRTGKVSDNNYATALGFIQALRLMMKKNGKDIGREKILQIGYGTVGKEAAAILENHSVDFDLYDKDQQVLSGTAHKKLQNKDEIKNYSYILDFTNEGSWLAGCDLAGDILYASPGVPYSMDAEAAERFEDRAVHDNLEIGTAVMLGQCLAG